MRHSLLGGGGIGDGGMYTLYEALITGGGIGDGGNVHII